MEIKFFPSKRPDKGSFPLEQEKVTAYLDDVLGYAFDYALRYAKEIKDPAQAAKEFKERSTEFLTALFEKE